MGWAARLVDDKSQSVPTSGNAQQDAGGLWDLDEMNVRPPMGWAAGLDDEGIIDEMIVRPPMGWAART